MAGALAIAWVLLGAPGLTAQDERATVRLDGRPVLRVAGTDTADAGSRAERIERRLGTLAGVSGTVGPARTERNAAGEPVITVSGIPLLTVTRADAEANVSASPLALAAMVVLALTWGLAAAVRRLRRALFQRLISDRTVENLIRQ